MAMAMQRLVDAGTLKAVPIRDYVAATSVGIVDGAIMLDLAYEEDSRADVDANFVVTGSNKMVELQFTAERCPFGDEQMLTMLSLARQGISDLIEKQRAVLQGLKLLQ
jgi:ribonuclease PH